MAKSSHKAMREMLRAITDLAEVVRELDPGKVQTYDRVAGALEHARGHLTQAEAFE